MLYAQWIEDSTHKLNKAIKALGGENNTLHVPAGTYNIDASVGLILKSNINIVFDDGAILKAIPNGRTHYDVIIGEDIKNVTITGGTIIGERYNHLDTAGEWGHGIGLYNCKNVVVDGMTIRDCWGDGIYLGSHNGIDASAGNKYVEIKNCLVENNRRNNISIVCADDCTINNCDLNRANGTAPGYGIDIEPNYSTNPCERLKIINCRFNDNAEAALGIIVISKDILIEGCELNGWLINYAGENLRVSNTVINDNVYLKCPAQLDDDVVINGNTTTSDSLLCSINPDSDIYKLKGYKTSATNPMKYSMVEEQSGDEMVRFLRIERVVNGTGEAGYNINLSDYPEFAGRSLENGKSYRFEYTVRGKGEWRMGTNQTGEYWLSPSTTGFFEGVMCENAEISASDTQIYFKALSKAKGSYLDIINIKVYEMK